MSEVEKIHNVVKDSCYFPMLADYEAMMRLATRLERQRDIAVEALSWYAQVPNSTAANALAKIKEIQT